MSKTGISNALWQQFQQGDDLAFAQLYRLLYADLLRFGHSVYPDAATVQDAILDVFTQLWTRHRQRPIDSIYPFLVTSLRNRLLDRHRQNQTSRSQSVTDASDRVPSTETQLIASESAQQQRALLRRHLDRLPARQSEAIYWRYFVGLDYPEIAQRMEVNQQVAYNYVNRGLQKLRKEAQAILRSLSIWLPLLMMV